MRTTRRDFVKQTSLTTAGLVVGVGAGWSRGIAPANERINVGLIGCRNQGFYVLREFLNTGQVNCVGLCDVDQNIRDEKLAILKKDYQQSPSIYGDFRKMLDDKNLDAVIIGTPDHWHCLQTVYACEAGKDVYVEKPLANSIGECYQMVAAANKHNRVIQVGQQQRSSGVWQGAMDYIKSGAIGTLMKVNIWANFNYGIGSPKQADQGVPQGVDFDAWLGPAPLRSFNPTRFHGNWRHFWDYGGGLMTDWGVHLLDMALWAKDITMAPKQVMGYGNNLAFPEYSRETYDTMSVIFPMDDYVINWQHAAGNQTGPYDKPYGVEFVGDKATVVADRGDWSVKLANKEDTAQAVLEAEKFKRSGEHSDVGSHVRNFMDCMRTRNKTNCPIEAGSNVAIYAHMGNIAARSGSGKLVWDDQAHRFDNDAKANALIMPKYRESWALSGI